jgi:hypothetical protein
MKKRLIIFFAVMLAAISLAAYYPSQDIWNVVYDEPSAAIKVTGSTGGSGITTTIDSITATTYPKYGAVDTTGNAYAVAMGIGTASEKLSLTLANTDDSDTLYYKIRIYQDKTDTNCYYEYASESDLAPSTRLNVLHSFPFDSVAVLTKSYTTDSTAVHRIRAMTIKQGN